MKRHSTKRPSAFLPVVLLAAAGLASSVFGQAQPLVPDSPAWSLGQPNAKVLVSLNLKSLRESPVGQLLGKQIRSQVPQQGGPIVVALPFVMQALNDVDRVLISSPANVPFGPGDPAKESTPFLMVVEGRFGPGSPLGFFMTGSPEAYHGVNVYTPPAVGQAKAAKNINLALLNEGTLLIGDAESVHGAIDRQGQSNAGISTGLRARASALSQTHDFWVILQESLAGLPSNPALAGAASEIEGVELGLGLREGFQMDATLATKSEAMARAMSQFLASQLKSGLASSQIDNAQAAELASKLHISSQGKEMRLSLRLTPEELDHQMRTLQTQHALARTLQSQPKTQTKEQIRLQPQPLPAGDKMAAGKIRIYGLDEGPREIEVPRQRF